MNKVSQYLESTYFIDSDSTLIQKTALSLIDSTKNNVIEKAKTIFYFTRDQIRYDPYTSFSDEREHYRASYILKRKKGWCVQKACLLAALGRALEIPARLHFADIKNYAVPEKLENIMGTNIFIFHGYTELYIKNRWVKATPAFNIEMCEKLGLKTVEFDGIHDAILPEATLNGEKYIEYLNDRGFFSEFPFDSIFRTLKEHYEFV